MARVNLDPHLHHFTFSLTNHLTALFETVEAAQQAARALEASGFLDDEIDLFFGEEGANKLDLTEEHHGLTGRLLRTVEYLVTDDGLIHRRSDCALREGHAIVAVKTANAQQKNNAGQLLRDAGGHDIHFWGAWTTEQLG